MDPHANPLRLPNARGPLSSWVLDRLVGIERPIPTRHAFGGLDGDAQLALYLCYEPHFSDLPGITGDPEWDPDLVAVRRRLEVAFERGLRRSVAGPGRLDVSDVGEIIEQVIADDVGPSVSRHIERDGTMDELREVVVQRSAYQLKEADPHTFGLPTEGGRPAHVRPTSYPGPGEATAGRDPGGRVRR